VPYIDLHTHILPGLDDGPATMSESLALARALVEEGFATAVATPHCWEGRPVATDILKSLKELQEELKQAHIPLTVLPGAEHAMDPYLVQRLEAGELLTLNNSRFILLESPVFQPLPHYAGELIFELRLHGFYPVLAHPERCAAFQNHPDRLARLVHAGALTQLTLGSLTGSMGPLPARAAASFFRCGLAHILATDAHGGGVRMEQTGAALAQAQKLGGPEALELLIIKRPAAILRDELPPLPEPEEKVSTVRRGLFRNLYRNRY